MKHHFIFPVSMLNNRVIDEAFQDQAIVLKQAGFGTSAFDIVNNKIVGAQPDQGTPVVYRGWMMTPVEYGFFWGWMIGRGLEPLTNLEQYKTAHYLPEWYNILRSVTAETIFPTNSDSTVVAEQINATGWQTVFIKDYVKSLKTDEKPLLDTPVTAENFMRIMEKMRKYRGTIEGGAVVRQYENYYPNSEKRYFIIKGKFYGQETSFDMRAMNLLVRVARDIPSPFFSVDIAERTDGTFRVVELGDGQVSDLVGWTYERFAEIWQEASGK
jgi:ATP-grasp domain, R2K clade family 3